MAAGRPVDGAGEADRPDEQGGRRVELPVPFGKADRDGGPIPVGSAGPGPAALEAPISSLPGIGPRSEEQAAAVGIHSVLDLLWRVPRTYAEAPPVRSIADLQTGDRATLRVEVRSVRAFRGGRRPVRIVEATTGDETGTVRATWFNRPWVAAQLAGGGWFEIEGRLGDRGFVVDRHQPLADGSSPSETPRPVHGASGGTGSARWAGWTAKAVDLADRAVDPLPSELLVLHGYPGAGAALTEVHRPLASERSDLALERLAYEELFLHQVLIAVRSARERAGAAEAIVIAPGDQCHAEWLGSLPFRPTGDQSRAIAEIGEDLGSGRPMRRLLMGEVGSGKTVVALSAMVRAIGSGHQAALMAPTEVLAEQHHRSITGLLGDPGVGIRCHLLTGSTGRAERASISASLESGEPSITVGTHALIQDGVPFTSLAVAVIDEEHRFGVAQRMALDGMAGEGRTVHRLHLSATPIPRTLALTAWGDLDISEIRGLPAGRRPIETEVVTEAGRLEAFEYLKAEIARGHQGFVICPLVEESEAVQAKAAETEFSRLAGAELAGHRLGLLHGRLDPAEKESAMKEFAEGRTDVLVATTVVEVGIDVPNATVMVIEGAESFGLAQLHQLRGRIGRGDSPGRCYLVSGRGGPNAARRLQAVATERDGFRLAELDLELRGEGELAGRRQHGLPAFRVARLPDDRDLLVEARADLGRLMAREGGLGGPVLAPAVEAALARFGPAGVI